jgi:hypothetical protein
MQVFFFEIITLDSEHYFFRVPVNKEGNGAHVLRITFVNRLLFIFYFTIVFFPVLQLILITNNCLCFLGKKYSVELSLELDSCGIIPKKANHFFTIAFSLTNLVICL